MIKNKSIQQLLGKDMTRKQFLQIVAAGLLGLIGFTNFINNLDKFVGSHTDNRSSKDIASGYGGSAYGS